MSCRVSLVLFVTLTIVCIGYGDIYMLPATVLKDHPGKCFFEPTKKFYVPGEPFDLKDECARLTCVQGAKELEYYGENCSKPIPPHQYCDFVPEDQSKPYPDCCETYVC
ncbi:uncharacterized protein LOC113374047 [Ctenocephalides felis]|uniref:uncharacterized protein LOC113374047 n=1 Tax=Ctenocephalides felis TaxID=7515 RepID=UPI000E6E1C1D|nr:uncharacterized protein LOC113374047 [Ctenocephalides felis]